MDNTSATTDQSGIVRVHLTSSKAGSYSVDASLEADKIFTSRSRSPWSQTGNNR
ncbi:hypothetical protein FA039_29975 [Escherichia coli]|nr:hypothetical protein [Escherichia coli]